MPNIRTSQTGRRAPTAGRATKRACSLTEGYEECPHCEQPYAYEAEARCARCDAPICQFCVSPSGKNTLCPACVSGGR